MKCRHCQNALSLQLVDLGTAPPSNAYLTADRLHLPEKWYPLRVLICTNCWLGQTEDYAGREELFSSDYAYFSSYSKTWLDHASNYVDQMVRRFDIRADSLVVEVAANDGYLLQYVRAQGIPCLGVEPTASTAAAARAKGIEVVGDFFGARLAAKLADSGRRADLVVANNVLAHVPDINDFVRGFAYLMKPDGVVTFEFPHLLRLIGESQFDTIYHEHYSYLSFIAVNRILRENRLSVFDVEELPTHGGSLRVYAQCLDTGKQPATVAVSQLLGHEAKCGVRSEGYYAGFQKAANGIKNELVTFLIDAASKRAKVAAYGAAAKGSTLLNYAGVRSDLVPYVVDRNPAKQGKYLPGCRIPIVAEERIRSDKPDWVLILPWNIKDEVIAQLAYIREWGGRFVTAVPGLCII